MVAHLTEQLSARQWSSFRTRCAVPRLSRSLRSSSFEAGANGLPLLYPASPQVVDCIGTCSVELHGFPDWSKTSG